MKKIFYQSILFIVVGFSIIVTAQPNSRVLIKREGRIFMVPVWSPDGSMIAFTSAGYKGIWVMNLQNKEIKQITDEDAAGFAFKWSGNSGAILTRVAKYEDARRYNAVKIFNIKSDESTLLTGYRTMMPGLPEFTSADEKVFIYNKGKPEIFDSGIKTNVIKKTNASEKVVYIKENKIDVEDLNTGQINMFEPVKGERVLNLQKSSDGNKVVFEIIGGDIYVMNVDGSGLTDLGRGYRPQWSPDNQHIVYMITKDDGYQILSSDIYTIKIDGTEKRNLTKTDDKLEMDPSWSPDGKKIAYDITNNGAIYIMEIE